MQSKGSPDSKLTLGLLAIALLLVPLLSVISTGQAWAQDGQTWLPNLQGNNGVGQAFISEPSRVLLPALQDASVDNNPPESPVLERALETTDAGFVVDHTSVALFDEIPPEYLEAARNLHMVFSDRSVGGNIDMALNCLSTTDSWTTAPAYCRRDYYNDSWAWKTFGRRDHSAGTVPDRILFNPDRDVYDRSNWTFVYKAGHWTYLTQDFIETLAPSHIGNNDVLSYQFSYLNVDEGDDIADPDHGFFANNADRYDVYDLEAYIAKYPDKVFFFWTTSLARSIGTQVSTDFNEQMRQYARANGKILFDVADIEAHTDQGVPCYDNRDGIQYCTQAGNCENHPDDGQEWPAICQDYTTEIDGGHLGSVSGGQIAIAKAFWVLMARIAGWNPDSTPLPTDTPAPTPTDTTDRMPTDTPQPTPTDMPQPTATDTPQPTPTDTAEPMPTETTEPNRGSIEHMVDSHDSTLATGVSVANLSINAGVGTDRLLVAYAMVRAPFGATDIVSFTYNGVELTHATSVRNLDPDNIALWVDVYYLANPSDGDSNLQVAYDGRVGQLVLGGAVFHNVEQANPLDQINTAQGSGDEPGVTIAPTQGGELVFGAIIHDDSFYAAPDGGVESLENLDRGAWVTSVVYDVQETAGARTVGWSTSSSDYFALALASFKANGH